MRNFFYLAAVVLAATAGSTAAETCASYTTECPSTKIAAEDDATCQDATCTVDECCVDPSIPGRIQVENFDGYKDSTTGNKNTRDPPDFRTDTDVDMATIEDPPDGGIFVGWTEGGEWLRFTVNVVEKAPGFEIRFSTIYSGSFRVVTGDPQNFQGAQNPCAKDAVVTDLSGIVEFDNGLPEVSRGDFQQATANVGGLERGPATIWFCVVKGGFSIDWFELAETCASYTCPSTKIAADDDATCQDATCTVDECCVDQTCASYTTECPFTKIAADDDAKCQDVTCTVDECCLDQTCASYTTECPFTKIAADDDATCQDVTCTVDECCLDPCDDDEVCGHDEICCPVKKVCEVPVQGTNPAACGDPHMTGFLGQKFDFTGQDGGWYCLIKDDSVQVNMRVTSPVPSVPEITYITGLAVLAAGADGFSHEILIEVKNPHRLESSCPVGVSPCLADGSLEVTIDGQEAMLAPGVVELGGGVEIAAANLPGACRSFGFEKYWEKKMLEYARAGHRRLRESFSMGEWIVGDPTVTNMDECVEYVARAETEPGGVFAHQSEHASFQIVTSKATLRLSHGRLHQEAMRDPSDMFDLPDHLTWQMNFAVDHNQVSLDATGILGETRVPILDDSGKAIMQGMGAIRGFQEEYRVEGPLGTAFVQGIREA